MPKLSFYILQSTEARARLLFICKLVDKIYRLGHKIFIYVNNQHSAEELDKLLWTYKQDSFLPHQILNDATDKDLPITISFGQVTPNNPDILINLCDNIPDFANEFNRILEVVDQNPGHLTVSRNHYREYKALDLEIENIKI